MSQISQPVRIILIGAVVFLAAWFTVLRPKAETIEPTTTTTTQPATGLGKAVASAKQAAGTTRSPTESKPGAATTPAPGAKPGAPAVAIPAEALAKLPNDVARALKAHEVVVLGVIADGAKPWRPLADDDRYVRNTLRHVNRYDGDVLVKQVPIAKLSGYGSLVNDLQVHQTPSVVVIDADLKGSVLIGYVDRVAIDQAIADARRASIEPNIKDAYLSQANQFCGRFETRITRWSLPTIPGSKAEIASLARIVKIVKDYRHGLVRLPAPAKWRGLKSQWVRVVTMRQQTLAKASKAAAAKDATAWNAAAAGFDSKQVLSLDRRFDAAGLTDCSIQRRS